MYTLDGDVIIFTPLHARLEIQEISSHKKGTENFEISRYKKSQSKGGGERNEEKCDECKMNVNISRRKILKMKLWFSNEKKNCCLRRIRKRNCRLF